MMLMAGMIFFPGLSTGRGHRHQMEFREKQEMKIKKACRKWLCDSWS